MDRDSFSLSDGTLVRPCRPFFITGSGRCGTTLLRRLIIERAPAVIPPENHILPLTAQVFGRIGADWPQFCRVMLTGLREYANNWADYGIDADAALALLLSLPANRRSGASFWHAFNTIYAARMERPGVTAWGDKTPANVDALPEILRAFPQARFVFLVRDVFDVAWSYGSMALPDRCGNYLGGAQRWLEANAKLLEFAEHHAQQAIILRYEELVQDPGRQMQQLLARLDLPECAPRCLNERETRDMAAHPSLCNAVGAVSTGYIGKGRAHLPREVKQHIARMAAALQRSFGYEPTGSVAAIRRNDDGSHCPGRARCDASTA